MTDHKVSPAWKQAYQEVARTPLSQIRERFGTGDLFQAVKRRAAELDTVAPEASGADYVLVPREPTPAMLEAGEINCPEEWGSGHRFDRDDVADLWAALLAAAPINPAPPTSDRNAYEGAREDLLDWKRRAQRAEATLRSLGYTGITPDQPPTTRTSGECMHEYDGGVLTCTRCGMHYTPGPIVDGVKLAHNFTELQAKVSDFITAKPTPADESGAFDGETIRPAFERWAEPQGLRLTRRDFEGSKRLGQYCLDATQVAFEAWRECARLTPASATPTGVCELPPLPPRECGAHTGFIATYTEEQMRAYGRAAIDAARRARGESNG